MASIVLAGLAGYFWFQGAAKEPDEIRLHPAGARHDVVWHREKRPGDLDHLRKNVLPPLPEHNSIEALVRMDAHLPPETTSAYNELWHRQEQRNQEEDHWALRRL